MQHKNEEYITLLENFIEDYWERFGVAPTTRAIADGTKLSNATVGRYLQYMREHDLIDYQGHRSYRTKKQIAGEAVQNSVPVLGRIACGIPKFAEENIEEYVKLPESLFGAGSFYLLHADGESMTDAGIDDGDLVLIRRQPDAQPGQIVVALIGDEATLKRYYPEPENHRVRLHPENSSMDDIYVENCEIQGVAVKVLKDLH
ncbi:MAG: transcriptional repressor LexA [Bilifractor sp.]